MSSKRNWFVVLFAASVAACSSSNIVAGQNASTADSARSGGAAGSGGASATGGVGGTASGVGGTTSHAASPDVPGYFDTLACSKFDVGPNPTTITQNGWKKTEGPDGVFSVRLSNRAARGIPSTNSSGLQVGEYSSSADVHNQHVEDYFVGCGMAQDQIERVDTGTLMGVVGGNWYTSSLVRAVDGIPIIGSIATARFNANDQTVDEAVCWPTIPGSVVDAAKAFEAKIATPAALAAYQALLPTQNKSGQVVIHHTGMDYTGSFMAVAVYDVLDGQTIHHFDSNGQEVKLPWE